MNQASDRSPSDSASPSTAQRSAARRTAVVGFVLASIGFAVLASWLWWGTGTDRRRTHIGPVTLTGRAPLDGRFVGSRICGECHPGELAAYEGSGHARTLRRAGSAARTHRLDGREAADPEYVAVRWHYSVDGDRLVAERKDKDASRRYLLDYALGSGRHAVTFVTLHRQETGPPSGLEHRLTYFARDDAFHLTPGQSGTKPQPGLTPDGFELPPRVVLDCFECHGTRTTAPRGGGLAPETLIANVTCERCHGPGRFHVEAARRRGAPARMLAMPFGPERETAAQQLEMCGRCHRLPHMVPAGTIRPDNASLARFPSVGMSQSACYKESSGALFCTTCHDPHSRVSGRTDAYEAACRSCHRPPGEKPLEAESHAEPVICPVDAHAGCLGCHMPRRDVGNGLLFTDHWIRRPPESGRDPSPEDKNE